jgi:hypothetical protein
MMILYIYNEDTKKIVATVSGDTNEECEKRAADLDYDQDEYQWAYNDNGLHW